MEHGRRQIDRIARPYMPRVFDLADWRDYTTERRLDTLRAIETAAADYAVGQEANLARCPAARRALLAAAAGL